MEFVLRLYDWICCAVCKHEWVRERIDGELYECCIKCRKRHLDPMTALVRWDIRYNPVEPVSQPELPPPLLRPEESMKRAT